MPSLAEAPTLSPRLFQHTWSKVSTDYRELPGTHLEYAPCALVGVNQLAALGVPDVDTPGVEQWQGGGRNQVDVEEWPSSYLSKLPLARNLPQGEKATLYTGSLCLMGGGCLKV